MYLTSRLRSLSASSVKPRVIVIILNPLTFLQPLGEKDEPGVPEGSDESDSGPEDVR